MTLIVGYRFENYYILAADSRVTTYNLGVVSEDFNKIRYYKDYIFAGAGSCTSDSLIKHFLKESLDAPLDCIDTEKYNYMTEGASILLKMSPFNKVLDIFQLDIHEQSDCSTVAIRNLKEENMQLSVLGCGESMFLGAFATFKPPTTLAQAQKQIKRCMEIVGKINAGCNSNIKLNVYEMHHE